MKIKKNTKYQILKTYLKDIPIIILAYTFLAYMTFVLANITIETFFDINHKTTTTITWVFSLIIIFSLLPFLIVTQLNKIFKSKIEITKSLLILNGINRSKKVNKIIPLKVIDEIKLGGYYKDTIFFIRRQGVVKKTMDSRLNIFTKSGQLYQLDSVTNIFDKNSLIESLLTLEEKGIKISIYKNKFNIKIWLYWSGIWIYFIYLFIKAQ